MLRDLKLNVLNSNCLLADNITHNTDHQRIGALSSFYPLISLKLNSQTILFCG